MMKGIVLLAVIGLYIFALSASGRAAADLYENHPVGSPVGNIEDIESPFLLNRMGPGPDPDQPGAEFAIYCATLTMCDTSCRLTVKDGSVIEARFSDH